ncbi:MAG: ATP-binding protein [Planctomycetota bacterium]|nr:ATP-binding protein [Planctomycetota bacterium]
MRFEQFKSVYRSLRFRLTMWNSAVVLLTAVAALFALREGLRVTLLHETDQRLNEDSNEIALAIRELYPDIQLIQKELERKAEGHRVHGFFVRLMGPDGNQIWATSKAPPLPGGKGSITDDNTLVTVGDNRITHRTIRLADGTVFRVRIGTSLRFIEDEVGRLTGIIVLIGGVILVLSPVGGYWLAGRATRPLADMHRTAAALRPDRLDERLQIRHTGDELDRLSETINGLLDRIASYIDRHRQFLANAAHELRSPLTAVQSSVEVALNVGRSPKEYEELLYEVADECANLRGLVNQVLMLAEVEIGATQTLIEEVPFHQIVAKSAEMFRGVAEERNIELRVGRLEKVVVTGQAIRLRQVLNNLIDNAIKFNQAGGWVSIELTVDLPKQQARLVIADSGPGIPEADLPHIFERFYRGDRGRTRDPAMHGSGLGLSICQAIVVLYGGSIKATNLPDHGVQFVVSIPVAPQATELAGNPQASAYP